MSQEIAGRGKLGFRYGMSRGVRCRLIHGQCATWGTIYFSLLPTAGKGAGPFMSGIIIPDIGKQNYAYSLH